MTSDKLIKAIAQFEKDNQATIDLIIDINKADDSFSTSPMQARYAVKGSLRANAIKGGILGAKDKGDLQDVIMKCNDRETVTFLTQIQVKLTYDDLVACYLARRTEENNHIGFKLIMPKQLLNYYDYSLKHKRAKKAQKTELEQADEDAKQGKFAGGYDSLEEFRKALRS